MAFTAINTSEVAAGEPTKQELFTKIKDNFDDHESRIATAEVAVNNFEPLTLNIKGPGKITDQLCAPYRVTRALTLTSARALVEEAGSSGTAEFDIELSTNNGTSWTSILSAAMQIASGSGDYAITTGTLSTTSVTASDLLRVVQNANQDGTETGYRIILEYEVA